MVTRREFLVRSMGTTALFLAGACSTAPAAAPAAGKPSGGLKTVRLAVQGPFLPLAAPFIAKRKGYFEEAGIDVAEVKLAPSGTPALVAGELDCMVGGGSDVMLLADKGETATAIVGLVRGMQLHLEVHPDVAQQRGV